VGSPTLLRASAAAVAAAAIVALGACGSSGGQSSGPDTQATSGEAIFREAGCGGCHSLVAAGTQGGAGPSLDDAKPSAPAVASKVRSGGGGMPSFAGRLSDRQIEAVADYVARSAGGR
jgi:mono/diheme cytochrome c family protein